MTRDRFASLQIRSQRMDRGLSPEQLGAIVGVSGHTIRRIERSGCVPGPRVQFLLAHYFEMRPTDLWRIPGLSAAMAVAA